LLGIEKIAIVLGFLAFGRARPMPVRTATAATQARRSGGAAPVLTVTPVPLYRSAEQHAEALLAYLQDPLPLEMAAPGVCILATQRQPHMQQVYGAMCLQQGWAQHPWDNVAGHYCQMTTAGFKIYVGPERRRAHFVPAPGRPNAAAVATPNRRRTKLERPWLQAPLFEPRGMTAEGEVAMHPARGSEQAAEARIKACGTAVGPARHNRRQPPADVPQLAHAA